MAQPRGKEVCIFSYTLFCVYKRYTLYKYFGDEINIVQYILKYSLPIPNMDNKIKEFLKKFWFIVWKDDSLKGWFISIVFLFIVIKFIFFPILSLMTGTILPLAIVESCSMYHKGDMFSSFDSWWEKHEEKYTPLNISKEEFKKLIFRNGFNKGDILFIVGANPDKIKIGDVLIFDGSSRNPLIHRVVGIKEENSKKIFTTMGDNNWGTLDVEKEIQENQIIGKASSRLVPLVGWIKLIFFEGRRSANERGFCSEN